MGGVEGMSQREDVTHGRQRLSPRKQRLVAWKNRNIKPVYILVSRGY